MGVVQAGIGLLGKRRIEERARLEENFMHLDVGGQGAAFQGRDVVEVWIGAEKPGGQRCGEPALQPRSAAGLHERQASENLELYGRVRVARRNSAFTKWFGLPMPIAAASTISLPTAESTASVQASTPVERWAPWNIEFCSGQER